MGTDTNWLDIDLGSHSLGLKTNGTLWAWGDNYYGQLGDGSTTNKNIPTQVGTATNWVAIAADGFDSLALNSDGIMYGFGNNQYSQMGFPQYITSQFLTPTLISVSCSNLGVNPVKEELVSTAYPNPTNSSTTITLSSKQLTNYISYSITNMLGQQMGYFKNVPLNNNSFTIDLSNYSSGFYLVKINNEIISKIIKQ